MSLEIRCDFCGKEFVRNMIATVYVCTVCGARACPTCGQGKICNESNTCQVQRPRLVRQTG